MDHAIEATEELVSKLLLFAIVVILGDYIWPRKHTRRRRKPPQGSGPTGLHVQSDLELAVAVCAQNGGRWIVLRLGLRCIRGAYVGTQSIADRLHEGVRLLDHFCGVLEGIF